MVVVRFLLVNVLVSQLVSLLLHSIRWPFRLGYITSLLLQCSLAPVFVAVSAQCQVPYFVATKMSKIRRPSLTVPSADAFAAAGVAAIGTCCRLAAVRPVCLAPRAHHCFRVVAYQCVYKRTSLLLL